MTSEAIGPVHSENQQGGQTAGTINNNFAGTARESDELRETKRIALMSWKREAMDALRLLDDPVITPESVLDVLTQWYGRCGEWISNSLGEADFGEFSTASAFFPLTAAKRSQTSRDQVAVVTGPYLAKIDEFSKALR
jgi:hypothetical protein